MKLPCMRERKHQAFRENDGGNLVTVRPVLGTGFYWPCTAFSGKEMTFNFCTLVIFVTKVNVNKRAELSDE